MGKKQPKRWEVIESGLRAYMKEQQRNNNRENNDLT